MRHLPKVLLTAAPVAAIAVGLSTSPALAANGPPSLKHTGCTVTAYDPVAATKTVRFGYSCDPGLRIDVRQEVYDFDGRHDLSDLMSTKLFSYPGGSGTGQVLLRTTQWDGPSDHEAEVYQHLRFRVYGPTGPRPLSSWLDSVIVPVKTW